MQNRVTHEDAAEIAADIERTWVDATIAGNAERLAALFADDVVFLGSHPRMYVGRGELLEYLASVPMGVPMTIVFSDRQIRVVGPEAFTATSYVTFAITGEDSNRFRWAISWTIVAHGDGWRIVQHHASSRPES